MTVQTKPLAELTREAVEILTRELGILDTMRFMNQFATVAGDYPTERASLFDHLSLDEIFADIREHQIANSLGGEPR